MEEALNIGQIVIGVGALIAVVAPILRLNSSIVKLTVKLDTLAQDLLRNEGRITKHGLEIENNTKRLENHEVRICQLEKHIPE